MRANNRNYFSLARLRGCAALLAIVSLVAFAAVSNAAIITLSVNGAGDIILDSNNDGTMNDQGEGRFEWFGTREEATFCSNGWLMSTRTRLFRLPQA